MAHHQSDQEAHSKEGFHWLPEGMDVFSILLIILIIASVVIQLFYLILPRFFRTKLINIDLRVVDGKPAGIFGMSLSGLISIFFIFLTSLFGLQAGFYHPEVKSYETLENPEQRQFRHKELWSYQSYEYQSLILAAIWLGLNILMKTHRKEIMLEQEEQAAAGKAAGKLG